VEKAPANKQHTTGARVRAVILVVNRRVLKFPVALFMPGTSLGC
jgi:hypothetical protein